MARAKRTFGRIRRLPSGRYQCAYIGPDTLLHQAPRTFDTREDGEAWLTELDTAQLRKLVTLTGDAVAA